MKEEEEEQGLSWSSYLALLRAFVRCSSSCAEGHLGVRDKRKADGLRKRNGNTELPLPYRQGRFFPNECTHKKTKLYSYYGKRFRFDITGTKVFSSWVKRVPLLSEALGIFPPPLSFLIRGFRRGEMVFRHVAEVLGALHVVKRTASFSFRKSSKLRPTSPPRSA